MDLNPEKIFRAGSLIHPLLDPPSIMNLQSPFTNLRSLDIIPPFPYLYIHSTHIEMRLLLPVCLLFLLNAFAFGQQGSPLATEADLLSKPYSTHPAFLPYPLIADDHPALDHPSLASYCPILPGSLPGFRRMNCSMEEPDHFMYSRGSSLADKYGISPGLMTGPSERPQGLLSYHPPEINPSWLPRKTVTRDTLKKLKWEEWDLSGLIEDVIRMPSLPVIQ